VSAVSPLRLRPLRLGDEGQALAAQEELADESFEFLLSWQPEATDWASYLTKLARRRAGEVEPGFVPAALLGAFVGEELVGRVSIRFALNDFLRELGGHIGYGVRPAHRRRGYATEILGQALIIARAEGVERLLVTCDEGNVASARVIERHGGVLEDIRGGEDGGPAKRRYWID
jgi:predicted acetyltransferase